MGNSDLIIIINGLAFLIPGTKYTDEWEALEIAKTQYLEKIKREWNDAMNDPNVDRFSDYWNTEPKKIEVYPLTSNLSSP